MKIDATQVLMAVFAVFSSLIGLIQFFMKRELAITAKRLDAAHAEGKEAREDCKGEVAKVQLEAKAAREELKAEVKEARKEHADLAARLPREYVMREEFMRIMAGVENKLGGMDGKMDRLLERLTSHITIEATESSYNRMAADGRGG